MAFFFVCGQQTFRSEVKGYEGIVTQCHHCGNMGARVQKERPFFTICYIVRSCPPPPSARPSHRSHHYHRRMC